MHKNLLLVLAGLSTGLAIPHIVSAPQDDARPQTIQDFPNLARGLRETPGCVGVQNFGLNGGKTFAIAAWFENRKAMEAWYFGKMHQGAMAKFFPEYKSDRKPFAAFKDETAPLLVVATVTPGDKPLGNGSNLHVAQIAIEGYTPIPGGVAFGGSFAPKGFEVPGLIRIPAGG